MSSLVLPELLNHILEYYQKQSQLISTLPPQNPKDAYKIKFWTNLINFYTKEKGTGRLFKSSWKLNFSEK